jgi:hypothetical protein
MTKSTIAEPIEAGGEAIDKPDQPSEGRPARDRRATRHESPIAVLALVISVVAAVFSACAAYWQVYEARRSSRWSVWSNFLTQHDSDEMWQAKAIMKRYLKDLRRVAGAPKDGFPDFVTERTEHYIGHYVYSRDKSTNESDFEFLDKDEASKDHYFPISTGAGGA